MFASYKEREKVILAAMPANTKPSASLWQFIKAFCSQFRRVYSGGAVQVVIALIILAFALQVPYYVHLWLLVLYGFVACFDAWKEERQRGNVLENEIAGDKPKIVGFIKRITTQDWVEPLAEKPESLQKTFGKYTYKHLGKWITLKIGFVNESETPTSITNFSLIAKTAFGTYSADYPHIPKLADPNRITNYLLDQSKLVAKGHHIEGELIFQVEGVDELDLGLEVVLTIVDAWQNKHQIIQWGDPSFQDIPDIKRAKEMKAFLDNIDDIGKD